MTRHVVGVISITSVPMGYGRAPLWRASVDGALILPDDGGIYFLTKESARRAALAYLNLPSDQRYA